MAKTTASLIRYLRHKHNLSQEAMAKHLGVSQRAIAKWEAGIAEPKASRLYRRWTDGDDIAGEILAELLPRFSEVIRGGDRNA